MLFIVDTIGERLKQFARRLPVGSTHVLAYMIVLPLVTSVNFYDSCQADFFLKL